jgi:hypothetical protein
VNTEEREEVHVAGLKISQELPTAHLNSIPQVWVTILVT